MRTSAPAYPRLATSAWMRATTPAHGGDWA